MGKAGKTLDLDRPMALYLGMTQVCVDVALAALARKHGSRKAAAHAWKAMERAAAALRNRRSIVRWDHGGPR